MSFFVLSIIYQRGFIPYLIQCNIIKSNQIKSTRRHTSSFSNAPPHWKLSKYINMAYKRNRVDLIDLIDLNRLFYLQERYFVNEWMNNQTRWVQKNEWRMKKKIRDVCFSPHTKIILSWELLPLPLLELIIPPCWLLIPLLFTSHTPLLILDLAIVLVLFV